MTDLLAGAVASEHKLASEAGKRILSQGGNAVDAIIATILCVGVFAPYHSDIGGGGFAIVRTSQGEFEALNFRHTAPSKATNEFYRDGGDSKLGGSSVAVPGTIRGLEQLHKRHGKLPWATLFEPAIEHAKGGIEVTQELIDHITIDSEMNAQPKSNEEWMRETPSFLDLFFHGKKDGERIQLGEKWYRPEEVKALEYIAREGAKGLHEGPIAEAIVKVVQETGGLMTLEDLRDYRAVWQKPLTTKYGRYTVTSPPAPCSGAIFLAALGLLSRLPKVERDSHLESHRLTEVLKIIYGLRVDLGDPDFVPGLDELQSHWLSEKGMEQNLARISDDRTFPYEHYRQPKVDIKYDNGTSNITTADSSGLVVSITTTIGMNWGSRLFVPGWGFMLNQNIEDFSVEGRPNSWGVAPQVTNFIRGGKRPLSSNCPFIIVDEANRPVFAGGAAGGPTISSGNIQVARNFLEYGDSALDALSHRRLHNQLVPDFTRLEPSSSTNGIPIKGHSDEDAQQLKAKGHKIAWFTKRNYTEVCALSITYGEGSGASTMTFDPRGEPRRENSGGSVFTPA